MDRDLVAFALRPEYEPTFDGDTQTSGFAGGVLATVRGDLHVKDSLADGDGKIVLRANIDSGTVELLRVYPPLVEVDVEPDSEFLSPYGRLDLDGLQSEAELRGLPQAASTSESRIIAALDAHDDAREQGQPIPPDLVGDPKPEPQPAISDDLTKDVLQGIADQVDVDVSDAKTKAEMVEILAAAGHTTIPTPPEA